MLQKKIRGFTLIEVVMSVVILALIVLWSGQILYYNMQMENKTKEIDNALQIARSRLDELHGHVWRGDIRIFLDEPAWVQGDTVTVTLHRSFFTQHFIEKTDMTWLPGGGGHNIFEATVSIYRTSSHNLTDITIPAGATSLATFTTRMGEAVEGEI